MIKQRRTTAALVLFQLAALAQARAAAQSSTAFEVAAVKPVEHDSSARPLQGWTTGVEQAQDGEPAADGRQRRFKSVSVNNSQPS